ncbi:hypothetical protein WJX73_003641 [Symbiochloris irregularis]|uniref:Protein kinase domain-containing protein n=1 Tax=Symbiochloris irregularis TaxID=706552 RepID=A0AAW1PSL9_9CHLO
MGKRTPKQERGAGSFQIVQNVTITGDLHLTASNWPSTVAVYGTVFLRGGAYNGTTRTVLDFGNILNAIEVKSGASLGFEELLVTGMPGDAVGTALSEGLPLTQQSILYPSVVTFSNSSIIVNNTEFEIAAPRLNTTCQNFTDALSLTLEQQNHKGVTWTLGNDGMDTIINQGKSQPVYSQMTVTLSGVPQGYATYAWFGNQTYTCYDTPGQLPHSQDSAAHLDQLSPSSIAGGPGGEASGASSNLKGGLIAGVVVGPVVAIILLGTFLLFMRRQRRATGAQIDKASSAGRMLDGASSREMTSCATSTSKHPRPLPGLILPVQKLQAAAAALASSTSRNNACSWQGGDEGMQQQSLEAHRCMVQFDWHIPPDRLQVSDGLNATPIGVGGYGVVYKGQLDGYKPVAIKFTDPSQTDRFIKEVDLLRACRDKNIVECKGAWVQQGLAYMVLELMEGDLLRAIAHEQAGSPMLAAGLRQLGWPASGAGALCDSRGAAAHSRLMQTQTCATPADQTLVWPEDRHRLCPLTTPSTLA